MKIVSYGAGTNSTAMLVGMYERGIRPDVILFADTGGEKPHTYEIIPVISNWCQERGFPPITRIKAKQPMQIKDGSLEAECLRLGNLPSKAYGLGSCSHKWKVEVQDRWYRENGIHNPVRIIGIDADEAHRAERMRVNQPKIRWWMPLIDWDWGREECLEAIDRAGLPSPGKSACFFCPSTKRHEILELRENYPELIERALEMERRALAGEGPSPKTKIKGLGRRFSWARVIWEEDNQLSFTQDFGAPEMECGCYDG